MEIDAQTANVPCYREQGVAQWVAGSGCDWEIIDTGATAGGGNRTLGQYDVIGFIYNGAKWLESFFSDNS